MVSKTNAAHSPLATRHSPLATLKAKIMLLKLKGDRVGSFKRSARNEAGEVVRRYDWKPGVTVDVDPQDLTIVGDDILNGVLIPMKDDGSEATIDREQLADELSDAHDEAHQRRLAFAAEKQKQKDARRKPRPENKTAPAAKAKDGPK